MFLSQYNDLSFVFTVIIFFAQKLEKFPNGRMYFSSLNRRKFAYFLV